MKVFQYDPHMRIEVIIILFKNKVILIEKRSDLQGISRFRNFNIRLLHHGKELLLLCKKSD